LKHGILLLDKPLGLSSNQAVQRVRRVLNRIKAGHTGSLDPLASGMLPVCLGEATKVAGYLLDGDKEYLFTARFGARTATGDLEGAVVEQCAVPTDLAMALRAALPAFHGQQQQIPPMYSALKRDGEPLYRLARQGVEVEREARPITIHALELLAVHDAIARALLQRDLCPDVGGGSGARGGQLRAPESTASYGSGAVSERTDGDTGGAGGRPARGAAAAT
jgi:tRNA pseudouridine55 synthase